MTKEEKEVLEIINKHIDFKEGSIDRVGLVKSIIQFRSRELIEAKEKYSENDVFVDNTANILKRLYEFKGFEMDKINEFDELREMSKRVVESWNEIAKTKNEKN